MHKKGVTLCSVRLRVRRLAQPDRSRALSILSSTVSARSTACHLIEPMGRAVCMTIHCESTTCRHV